jgi:hypothetical protein
LLETYADVNVSNAKKRLLVASAKQMGASVLEMQSLEFFINEGFANDLFDIALDINEASFAERFKEMALKAKEKIKEKGKAALDKIGDGAKAALKFGGSLLSPLKTIMAKIKEAIEKAWEKMKGLASEAVSKAQEKIKEKIKPYLKDGAERQKILDELGNLKKTMKTAQAWAFNKYVDLVTRSAVKTATTDESLNVGYMKTFEYAFFNSAAILIENGYNVSKIQEELHVLEEGHDDSKGGLQIPFISTLMKKIGSIPPFSTFHKIEDVVSKGVAGGLNRFSAFMTRVADAPGPFTFPIIGGLLGVAAGYLAETIAKQGLFNLPSIIGFAIPGWGILIQIIKYVGLALAIYGIIEKLVGQDKKKEEDGDEGDKEPEKKPEESEE